MTVDVIIPVYKPGGEFYVLLKKLYEQTVIPKKVIILNTITDDCSMESVKVAIDNVFSGNDGAKDLKKPNIEIVPIKKKDFDHALTRNYGAKKSDADYFMFMTQDAMPNNEFLIEKLVEAMEKGAGAAFARQLPRAEAKKSERLSREFNYPSRSYVRTKADIEKYGVKAYFSSDTCMMYDRKRFMMLGGFGGKSIFAEDQIYAYKLLESGGTLAYVAEAEVIHSHNYGVKQQFKRNFDIGVYQTEHPEIFSSVSSEKEGVKYVKHVLGELSKEGKTKESAGFVTECAGRYLGYLMGKNYKKLPKGLVMKCTGNPDFFRKNR